MAQAGAVFLAYVDDEIVGGCQLLRMLDEPDFFYVVGFYMRPQWQGRAPGQGVPAGRGRRDAGRWAPRAWC